MKGGGGGFSTLFAVKMQFFFSKGKNNNSAKIAATTFTGANKLGIVSNRSSNQKFRWTRWEKKTANGYPNPRRKKIQEP